MFFGDFCKLNRTLIDCTCLEELQEVFVMLVVVVYPTGGFSFIAFECHPSPFSEL